MIDKNKNFTSQGKHPTGRLIDELVSYLRARKKTPGDAPGPPIDPDEERIIRAVLRHVRRNPIPAALLGASTAWLLLAESRQQEEEEPSPQVERIEDELIKQARGGLAYTNRRLRELVDQYPWATATAVIGGGLLAALLLPDRHPPVADEEITPEPDQDFDFDPLEEEEL